MTTSGTTAGVSAALASSLFRRSMSFSAASVLLPPSIASPHPAVAAAAAPPPARRRVFCQVAISTDLSSSSSAADEEAEAAAKVGRSVRVTVPLRVYHVLKAPELDLNGLEGTIKQCVALHKGKRVSANLPFKVEFQIEVEGQPRRVKFFAHLREDEFEYLPSKD